MNALVWHDLSKIPVHGTTCDACFTEYCQEQLISCAQCGTGFCDRHIQKHEH